MNSHIAPMNPYGTARTDIVSQHGQTDDSFAVIGVVCTGGLRRSVAAFRNVLPAAAANALRSSSPPCATPPQSPPHLRGSRPRRASPDHVAGLVALAVRRSYFGFAGPSRRVAPHRRPPDRDRRARRGECAATLVRFLLLRFAIDRVQEKTVAARRPDPHSLRSHIEKDTRMTQSPDLPSCRASGRGGLRSLVPRSRR